MKLLCYGCMQEKQNNEKICSNCGYTNGQGHEEHYYLSAGTLLNNRYLVGKALGHGGFGITYIGYDQQLQVRVAIKEYLPGDFATRQEGSKEVKTFSGSNAEQYQFGLKRFLDEARTLAKYNDHPCIVSTTNYFEENNSAYIVMEYLDGISLAEYLKRKGGRLSVDESIRIMLPIMDALKEVHKDGIIHRDVSPDNIYITTKGMMKLIDFGAARYAFGEKSQSLSVILKPGYAPPEQYSSRGKQGAWTDVYSVAATIYKLVHGENLLEAVDRLKTPEIEFDHSISEPIQYVLTKALSTDIEKRYQTISLLQEAIATPEKVSVNKEELEDLNTAQKTIIVHNNKRTKLFAGLSILLVIILLVTLVAMKNRPEEIVYQTVSYTITSDEIITYDNVITINPANDAFDGKGVYEIAYTEEGEYDFVEADGLEIVSKPIEIDADIDENKQRDTSKALYEVTMSYETHANEEALAVVNIDKGSYELIEGDVDSQANEITVSLDEIDVLAVVELQEPVEEEVIETTEKIGEDKIVHDNPFDYGQLHVGEYVGDMLAEAIEDEQFFRFQGPITVSGTYHHHYGYHGLEEEYVTEFYFKVSDKDRDLLPRLRGDQKHSEFLIGPVNMLEDELSGPNTSGTATLVIGEYQYVYKMESDYPINGEVIEVIEYQKTGEHEMVYMPYEMPNVLALTREKAIELLNERDIVYGIVEEESSTIEEGIVIAQAIQAGESAEGRRAMITVAVAPKDDNSIVYKVYSGALYSKDYTTDLPIHVYIGTDSNGNISAKYYYDKYEQFISLSYGYNYDLHEFKELYEGEVTGHFHLMSLDRDVLTGHWYNGTFDMKLEIYLKYEKEVEEKR